MPGSFATSSHIDDAQVSFTFPYALALGETNRLRTDVAVAAVLVGEAAMNRGSELVAVSANESKRIREDMDLKSLVHGNIC